MARSPLLDRNFRRFCGRLLKRAFVLLWGTLKDWNDFTGTIVIILLIAGVGASAGWLFQGLPWWVSAAIFLLLFFYGLLRASYELQQEKNEVEKEKDELEKKAEDKNKRVAVKDLLGEAMEKGQNLRSSGKAQRRANLPAARKWVERTHDLIEAAFDKAEARYFRGGEIDKGLDPVDGCLRRLDQLIIRAKELDGNPDFDPQAFDWEVEDFSQFDPTIELRQSEEENERLKAMRAQEEKAQRNRRLLVRELTELITEGDSLAGGSYITQSLVKDWEERAGKLIEMALSKERSREFLREDLSYPEWKQGIPEDASE